MSTITEAPRDAGPALASPRALLALGFVLGILSANRWSIPELAWVSLAPWLAHAATQRARRDRVELALTVLAGTVVGTAKVNTPPIPMAMALVFALPAAVTVMLGLLAYSAFVRRLGWQRATVAFAAVSALSDWLTFTGSPLGTWNMAVNTQLDNVALLQLLALGGPSAHSWLFALSNAVVALAIAAPRDVSRRAPTLAVGALVIAAYGYGLARMEGAQAGPSVRAAAVWTDVGPSAAGLPDEATLRRNEDALFARSSLAVSRGASLVAWNEAATLLAPSDEPALIERGRSFARARRVDFVMAYAVLLSRAPLRFDNQYRWFSPDGTELERYRKHHPVPGEGSVAGTDPLRAHDRPYGRSAGAICYDFDFPAFGRALGRLGVGIAVVSSSDWRGVDPSHGQVARMRAIEGGFSVLRPARHATNFGFDAFGRALAAAPAQGASDHVLVLDLPTAHVATPYLRFGDWPAALALIALMALAIESALALRPPWRLAAGAVPPAQP
jgi:apolipoprotein N-acyltransferase